MSDDKASATAGASADKTATTTTDDKPKASGDKDIMAVKVFAPFKVYFEGEAKSISAVNESGPFDILAHHHNFITMLLPCELAIHTPYEDKTFRISRGLMHVRDNKVIVFLDV